MAETLAFKGLSKAQDAIFSMYHIFVGLCDFCGEKKRDCSSYAKYSGFLNSTIFKWFDRGLLSVIKVFNNPKQCLS